ncbi:2OG-Fe(II) oxygenase [Anatilimnocola floriformis]|uniref:2OG-Fe(II) oxygenase n=1 Tax=Anatilimnocola floriformis TaxID=2948575 RepID=UPI0020C4D70E|nr:2OG-Fe(II) oxygenase [Anatilimnocola floriformis]
MPQAKALLQNGDPAPWLLATSIAGIPYKLDSHAGRYLVVSFFRSAGDATSQQLLRGLAAIGQRFDYDNVGFVGVSVDPQDQEQNRLADRGNGVRFVYDLDRSASKQFGAATLDPVSSPEQRDLYRRMTVVIDERLRTVATLLLEDNRADEHLKQLQAILDRLPPLPAESLAAVQAPILIVPRVFEPALCRELIAYYETQGGEVSGFMKDVNGKTVEIHNPDHKQRKDCEIADEDLRKRAMFAVHDRVGPEIQRAFQFHATRIERHIVACYDANDGGHFRAHRDNTTKGTAHRKFAVSLNLNTGEYDGGRLRFPEFGRLQYEAPAGGAVVFSCSLLHEATKITRGKRYAYLPFLYDEAAARIRQENQKFVADSSS